MQCSKFAPLSATIFDLNQSSRRRCLAGRGKHGPLLGSLTTVTSQPSCALACALSSTRRVPQATINRFAGDRQLF